MHVNRTYFNVNKSVPENYQVIVTPNEGNQTLKVPQKHPYLKEHPIDIANQSFAVTAKSLIVPAGAQYDDFAADIMNDALFFSHNTSDANSSGRKSPTQASINRKREPIRMSFLQGCLNEQLKATMASLKDSFANAIETIDYVHIVDDNKAKVNQSKSKNDISKNQPAQPTANKNYRETVYMASENAWAEPPTQSNQLNRNNNEANPVYLQQRRKRVQRTVGPKLPTLLKVEQNFVDFLQNNFDKSGNEISGNEDFDDVRSKLF